MKRISTVLKEAEKVPSINGFAILKPGFMDKEKDFMTLLQNKGWNVVSKKRGILTDEQVRSLYDMHKDKDFYKDLCKYMHSGESLCCGCYKDCEDPVKDMANIKDAVRKQWGQDEMKNAMHSSDSLDNVTREYDICCGANLVESIADDFIPQPVDTIPIEEHICNELKSLFAEEINAFYKYMIVMDFLVGPERSTIADKYKSYAMDELNDHAFKILKRLSQLNCDTSDLYDLYNIDTLSHAKFSAPQSVNVKDSLLENIYAEEAAIQHYRDVVSITNDVDPTTNTMLKEILADEEEHKSELNDFFKDIVAKDMSDVVPSQPFVY